MKMFRLLFLSCLAALAMSRRRLSLGEFVESLADAARISSMLFVV